jgi:class 3 adenylate cyclase
VNKNRKYSTIFLKGNGMQDNKNERKTDTFIESFLNEIEPVHCKQVKKDKENESIQWLETQEGKEKLQSFINNLGDSTKISEEEVNKTKEELRKKREVDEYASWIKIIFEKLIDDLQEKRFDDLIDLISSILKEYYLRLHIPLEQEKETADLSKERIVPSQQSRFFFTEVFIPILEKVSEWVITAPQSKSDEKVKKHKERMNVQSLYDLFATTVLLIAKEITKSKVSILFLTPDQVFLEAARMLKSPDQGKQPDQNKQMGSNGADNSVSIDDIRSIKKYTDWTKEISNQLAQAQSEVSSLVSSEIPTYMLDWTKSEKFNHKNTDDCAEMKKNDMSGNTTQQDGMQNNSDDHFMKMGITAYIAINYEDYRKKVAEDVAKTTGLEYTYKLVNYNSYEIQHHKAHLGKWDAVLWQGQRSNCQAILAVPISTTKLFIGILKVENPITITNDGRYNSDAEEYIRNLSCEVGSFFENYSKNKQVINHIWTAHVLSRISQRTTQLLELLERGVPLRTNFTKVIGYILTSLKLIYGAQEGVHVLSNAIFQPTENKKPLQCHVLDSFYPEYENRIRGILNQKGCENCEICRSFIHSRIIDNKELENTTLVNEIIAKERGTTEIHAVKDELDDRIKFMKMEDLEVWKTGLDPSTYRNDVYEVNFEFIPLLTQPKLLDCFSTLTNYNKRHLKDSLRTNYPLCPISLERNSSAAERATELTKLIINHKDCKNPDTRCTLCEVRKKQESEYFKRQALVFRLSANPYDFGIVILFFRDAPGLVRTDKLAIVDHYEKRAKDAIVTTTILNSVRILGKFLDSEYDNVKRFYIPHYRRPKVDKDVAILFADIRGYSKITKIIRMKNEFDILEEMVNNYYLTMGNIIQNYGRVHQFLGDGIMAIFGEHESEDKCKTVLSSVCCALAMEDIFKRISSDWLKNERMRDAQINENLKLALGVGINFGRVRFNYFGGKGHREYSPIGDHVNFAQRLMDHAARNYPLVDNAEKCHGDDGNNNDDSSIVTAPQGNIPPTPGSLFPGHTVSRYGDIVVSKTVFDFLADYLTEEGRLRLRLKNEYVKIFSFEYPIYCPRKEDLDMPKIARELGIDTTPLSGK